MDKQSIEEILKKIARKHGVSIEEVRREIERALAASNLSFAGEQPTPEEIVAHLAKVVEEKMKMGTGSYPS